MRKFFEFVGILSLVIASYFISAWGLMVFWNQVVLNVWQLFTTADVLNTMQISYGVFFAIAVGLNMVRNQKSESTDLSDAVIRVIAKVIGILITMLVVAIVF